MAVNDSNEASARDDGATPPPGVPEQQTKSKRVNYTVACVILALEAKAQDLKACVMTSGDAFNPNEGGSATAKHAARNKHIEAAGKVGDSLANSHHGEHCAGTPCTCVCAWGGGV